MNDLICPSCGSDHIKRSRRRPLERILFGLIIPYRCRDCYERFYLWTIVRAQRNFFRYLTCRNCPRCGTTRLRVSSRSKWGFFFFFILPMRCTQRVCSFSFWRINMLGPLIFLTEMGGRKKR